jgi:hypothetical protein
MSSHSSAIRQKLPQLRRLVSSISSLPSRFVDRRESFTSLQDDAELPAQIGFAIDNETIHLPKSEPHCVPQDMQGFLAKFIEEYYRLFDTSGRNELHACYHDSCMFSLCIAPTEGSMVPTKPYKYGPLIYDSRNFKRIFDDNKRTTLLRHGKSTVLDFLRVKFPPTKHDGKSFHVDVISTTVMRTMLVRAGRLTSSMCSRTIGLSSLSMDSIEKVRVCHVAGQIRQRLLAADQGVNGSVRTFQRTFTCLQTPSG